MILNFWNGISFYCMNGHEDPVPMVVMEGSTPFYACPKYMLKDEAHPDGHEPGEPGCPNRLSFTDAEQIVLTFSRMVEQAMEDDEIVDFTGLSFKYKMIQAKILKYRNKEDVRIGILNRRAIHV